MKFPWSRKSRNPKQAPGPAPAKPPAILQIVPSLNAGGAERTTADIAEALIEHGVRALVITAGGRLQGEIASYGGEVINMDVATKLPHRIVSNASAIADIIRDENVVLVHARSRAPAWSARMAAQRTGIPLVTTYHGIYNARLPFKRWYNSIMARGDAVIANSEWTARHILATYRFKPKHLTIIPRGIDLRVFSPEAVEPARVAAMRKWWLAKPSDRIVLLPGRLTRWKGQLVFLQALGRLKAESRLADVRAVIAGDAQGREAYVREIMNAIEDAGLSDIVTVATHLTDMPAAYLAADIVVSASTDPEAFGRVAPEASAMGRAVIATDHGGARETVRHGETGLLVKPGSDRALAEALDDLLSRSPAERAHMGANGRAFIAANFTLDRMCDDTLALYSTLIEERTARGAGHTGRGP